MAGAADRDHWWQGGVFYQIYPRSFADSNGDGVGDLRGIISRLDYLAELGISGVWLSPVTVSPDRDWGYDVADYCDIDPDYGTLDDLGTLVREGASRGIRILLDLVPNHTSDQHPWFIDARGGTEAAHRDYYVWSDPAPGGGPPNNWISLFGGSAWELDGASGQYYLHNFEAQQPDLNWWNDGVRQSFDDIIRFWWDRGVAGFRIDVCNMMIKDAELRDNPPATEDDPIEQQLMGLKSVYNSDRPETHDILQHWRTIAGTYEDTRLLIGETNVEALSALMQFYGTGADELHGGFNFLFINSPLEAASMRRIVEDVEALIPAVSWPIWTGSNHDVSRLATRWAGGDPGKVRCALLVLLTLRGTPFLYQGDEIGLEDGPIERADLHDRVGIRFWPHYKGRDAERTPMPWHGGPHGGFTEPGVRPWLPMADPASCNVADQAADPDSVLAFTRAVIARRRDNVDLALGTYGSLPSPEGTWVYGRGERTTVALNMSEVAQPVSAGAGHRGRGHRPGPRGIGRRRHRHAGPATVERRRDRVMTPRRFVLCTTPAQGHTTPLLALCRRLVSDGHQVVFFTTEHYRARVEATGARFFPFDPSYDAHDLMVANPARETSDKRGIRGVKDDLRRIFIGPIPGQYRGLQAIVEEFGPDAIVVDSMFLAALPYALGPRAARPAIVCIGVMPFAASSRDTAIFGIALQPGTSPWHRGRNWVLHAAAQHGALHDIQSLAQRSLAEVGAPRFKGYFIDLPPKVVDAYLQACTTGFEYPRSDLDASVRFIGPILAPPGSTFEEPSWWPELRGGRPVVHVTQGTLDNADLGRLLGPTLRALANEDVLVVATTGGPDPALLGDDLPANVRLERFIPHDLLLPKVDVMVTNGGYGGVQQALANGVPLVIAGDSEDKPEVAARVRWSGTGVNLRTGRPAPAKIARGVRRVLSHPSYRARAQALQAEIAATTPLDTISAVLAGLVESSRS